LKFQDALARLGWTRISHDWEYAKGDWQALFDSGSWWIVATKDNPRLPDVEVTGETDTDATWTVRLIEHLCALEDERQQLRRTLEQIRDSSDAGGARVTARNALNTALIGTFDPAGRSLPSYLVEHFNEMAAQQRRFSSALQATRDSVDPALPSAIARQALAACYHTWLVDSPRNELECPICGQRRAQT
jgi:hypothetical protein